MRKITKRSAAVVAGSALALAGGTAAFAYASGWFQGGGQVLAASSSIQPVTATANLGGSQANRLYPGKSVALSANVSNPNDYPVKITDISVASISAAKGGNPNTACGVNEADLKFTELPANLTVPAGQPPTPTSLGKVGMDTTADPACAGSVLTVTLAMTGEISG